jgi:hypothetical protein
MGCSDQWKWYLNHWPRPLDHTDPNLTLFAYFIRVYFYVEMGGVDLNEMMLCIYDDHRKTKTMWKRRMISIFHTMMLNAYILQTHNDDPQMPRLALITNVIEAFASEHLPNIRQVPITSKIFEKIPFVLSDVNIDKKNMCCAFATGRK